jgi:acyl dehydratase
MNLTAPQYWEDFEPGLHIGSQYRTITETDLVVYAGLVGDWSPLHIDVEYASQGPFGERIVHGNLALNLAVSLTVQYDRSLYRPEGYVRLLGWEGIRFTAPVRLGDTLHVDRTLTGREESAEAGMGILVYAVEVANQHAEAVLVGRERLLLRRRPPNGHGEG